MKANNLTLKTNRKFLIGATIVVLAVLHFTFSRFIAIEIEKDLTETEAVNYQPVIPVKEVETPKPEVVRASEPVAPAARKIKPETQAKRETERETTIRKKVAPRETRAERLRRAERILTGV